MTYPPLWDFKKKGKEVLAGTYTGAYHNIGRYKNSLYIIKQAEKTGRGKSFSIWGTREIKLALQMLPIGKKIRIQFLGRIKDKVHSTGIVHYQINVGKGNAPADIRNNRTHGKTVKDLAARGTTTRQRSARPLTAVGRGLAAPSAAKRIKKIAHRAVKRGGAVAIVDEQAPPRVTVPIPPPGYSTEKRVDFLQSWKDKIKKL